MDYKTTGYKFARLHQLRRWHVATRLKENEALYYGQLPLLEYIIENPGCKQKEVADRFALSRASITKSVKRMLNSGVITREVNTDDERQFKLYVTEKGKKLSDINRGIFDKADEMTYKGFSEEEYAQFEGYLDRMIENLETDYSRGKSPRTLMMEIQNLEKED